MRVLLGFRTAAVLAALAAAAPASALRGELCFPVEGWGVVSHWHVGSAARSVREGWWRGSFNDRGWGRIKAGDWLPRAEHGVWIRQAFECRKDLWRDFVMAPIDLPPGARMLVNGAETDLLSSASEFSLGPYLRKGTNTLIIVYPPLAERAARVPAIDLAGVSRTSGKRRSLGSLKIWRVSAEEVLAGIPDGWLSSSDTTPWRITSATPPTVDDRWLPAAPFCLKAVLDVPAYWRKRRLSVFLSSIPGSPAVHFNGERMVDRLACPARLDLGGKMLFNGRDTLCLVYDSVPASGSDADWGMAAVRWEAGAPRPRFESGAHLLLDLLEHGDQPGAARAARYAAELLAVSATSFDLAWMGTEPEIAAGEAYGPEVVPADDAPGVDGLMIVAWSATGFGTAAREAAVKAARDRCAAYRARSPGRCWIVTPPMAGGALGARDNARLEGHGKKLAAVAAECGARTVPFNDVCRTALRVRRQWPCAPAFWDHDAFLTPHGGFLMALAILEAFSLL